MEKIYVAELTNLNGDKIHIPIKSRWIWDIKRSIREACYFGCIEDNMKFEINGKDYIHVNIFEDDNGEVKAIDSECRAVISAK